MPCKQCTACLREDCGECRECKDKPKFGGPNKTHQRCKLRACTDKILTFVKPKVFMEKKNQKVRQRGAKRRHAFRPAHRRFAPRLTSYTLKSNYAPQPLGSRPKNKSTTYADQQQQQPESQLVQANQEQQQNGEQQPQPQPQPTLKQEEDPFDPSSQLSQTSTTSSTSSPNSTRPKRATSQTKQFPLPLSPLIDDSDDPLGESMGNYAYVHRNSGMGKVRMW